ncbi:MAG: hypothetical protein RO469_11835 [Thermincola sp.]|jgi:phage FluMu protein Com|nr:hypothetical protein [Thermincola sp.]MDT3703519.1 hypothetical protein [Thermincola sp.]
MIVATEFVVAMRCPSCGKLDFHLISRFAFAKEGTLKVTCSCGAPKLTIGTKNRQQYWLQMPCVLCETNHLAYYKAKQLWSNEVTFFYCNDTDVELGFFGPDEKVRALAENYEHNLESLVDELGYDDYFINPEVMFEVLNSLHDIAEEGFLYCECGSYQIEIDIFPERIELQCKDCKTVTVVYAETEEDLNRIKGIKKIELVKNGFKSLGNVDKAKKTKRKNTKRTKH